MFLYLLNLVKIATITYLKHDICSFPSLFHKYDADKNKVLSQSELKSLIQTVKFGDWKVNHDEIVETVMKDLDLNGDQEVSEQEFVSGLTKWLDKATDIARCSDAKQSIDEYDRVSQNEVVYIMIVY